MDMTEKRTGYGKWNNEDRSLEYECAVCYLQFSTYLELTNHRWKHVDRCIYCNQSFANRHKDKRKHEEHHSICNVCGLGFESDKTLTKHQTLLHITYKMIKSYPCEMCANTFRTPDLLLKHRYKHINNGALKYSQLDMRKFDPEKIFFKFKLYDNEIENPPYRCLQCNYIFWDNNSYNEHNNVKHGGKFESEKSIWDRKFKDCLKCKICDTTFSTEHDFRRHGKQHPGKCIFCTKCTNNKDIHESNHMLIHCNICFTINDTAEANVIHQTENHLTSMNNTCEICEQKLNNPKAFIKHRQEHLVDKSLRTDGNIDFNKIWGSQIQMEQPPTMFDKSNKCHSKEEMKKVPEINQIFAHQDEELETIAECSPTLDPQEVVKDIQEELKKVLEVSQAIGPLEVSETTQTSEHWDEDLETVSECSSTTPYLEEVTEDTEEELEMVSKCSKTFDAEKLVEDTKDELEKILDFSPCHWSSPEPQEVNEDTKEELQNVLGLNQASQEASEDKEELRNVLGLNLATQEASEETKEELRNVLGLNLATQEASEETKEELRNVLGLNLATQEASDETKKWLQSLFGFTKAAITQKNSSAVENEKDSISEQTNEAFLESTDNERQHEQQGSSSGIVEIRTILPTLATQCIKLPCKYKDCKVECKSNMKLYKHQKNDHKLDISYKAWCKRNVKLQKLENMFQKNTQKRNVKEKQVKCEKINTNQPNTNMLTEIETSLSTQATFNNYVCTACEVTYDTQYAHIEHMKYGHPTLPPAFCFVCLKLFSSLRSLTVHMKLQCEMVVKRCKTCNGIFPTTNSSRICTCKKNQFHKVKETEQKGMVRNSERKSARQEVRNSNRLPRNYSINNQSDGVVESRDNTVSDAAILDKRHASISVGQHGGNINENMKIRIAGYVGSLKETHTGHHERDYRRTAHVHEHIRAPPRNNQVHNKRIQGSCNVSHHTTTNDLATTGSSTMYPAHDDSFYKLGQQYLQNFNSRRFCNQVFDVPDGYSRGQYQHEGIRDSTRRDEIQYSDTRSLSARESDTSYENLLLQEPEEGYPRDENEERLVVCLTTNPEKNNSMTRKEVTVWGRLDKTPRVHEEQNDDIDSWKYEKGNSDLRDYLNEKVRDEPNEGSSEENFESDTHKQHYTLRNEDTRISPVQDYEYDRIGSQEMDSSNEQYDLRRRIRRSMSSQKEEQVHGKTYRLVGIRERDHSKESTQNSTLQSKNSYQKLDYDRLGSHETDSRDRKYDRRRRSRPRRCKKEKEQYQHRKRPRVGGSRERDHSSTQESREDGYKKMDYVEPYKRHSRERSKRFTKRSSSRSTASEHNTHNVRRDVRHGGSASRDEYSPDRRRQKRRSRSLSRERDYRASSTKEENSRTSKYENRGRRARQEGRQISGDARRKKQSKREEDASKPVATNLADIMGNFTPEQCQVFCQNFVKQMMQQQNVKSTAPSTSNPSHDTAFNQAFQQTVNPNTATPSWNQPSQQTANRNSWNQLNQHIVSPIVEPASWNQIQVPNVQPTNWNDPYQQIQIPNVQPTSWNQPYQQIVSPSLQPTGWNQPNQQIVSPSLQPTGWNQPNQQIVSPSLEPTSWNQPNQQIVAALQSTEKVNIETYIKQGSLTTLIPKMVSRQPVSPLLNINVLDPLSNSLQEQKQSRIQSSFSSDPRFSQQRFSTEDQAPTKKNFFLQPISPQATTPYSKTDDSHQTNSSKAHQSTVRRSRSPFRSRDPRVRQQLNSTKIRTYNSDRKSKTTKRSDQTKSSEVSRNRSSSRSQDRRRPQQSHSTRLNKTDKHMPRQAFPQTNNPQKNSTETQKAMLNQRLSSFQSKDHAFPKNDTSNQVQEPKLAILGQDSSITDNVQQTVYRQFFTAKQIRLPRMFNADQPVPLAPRQLAWPTQKKN